MDVSFRDYFSSGLQLELKQILLTQSENEIIVHTFGPYLQGKSLQEPQMKGGCLPQVSLQTMNSHVCVPALWPEALLRISASIPSFCSVSGTHDSPQFRIRNRF